MINKLITSEVLVAYSQCPRKAFFLLFSDHGGVPHDHIQALNRRKIANQHRYFKDFQKIHKNAKRYDGENLKECEFLTEVIVSTEHWEAYCDVLNKGDYSG